MNLKKLGNHELITPNSLATCLDFVSLWGAEPNRAQLGRLCAAAVGCCVDHASILPKYPVASGDPLAYGHKIMDRLLKAGVAPSDIYELGSRCLLEMAQKLPTEDEVEAQANFMQAPALEN